LLRVPTSDNADDCLIGVDVQSNLPIFASMGRGSMWIALAITVFAAIALHVLAREPADAFAAFPHTFIAAAGHDPATVAVVVAPLAGRVDPPEGCAPAWQCCEPPFCDGAGRPWLFPLRTGADGSPDIPKHPSGRFPAFASCTRYQTADGQRMLDSFATKQQPR